MKLSRSSFGISFGKLLFALVVILVAFRLSAQTFNYKLMLDTLSVPELGGIQSYAFGQSDGKWLIIGGRLDGLHRRQPWASFDQAGHNTQLLVVDPQNRQKWTASLASLPQELQEQLSSTNMEFEQDGDVLYLIGGYGYSKTADDHKTFPYLTAIDVPGLIGAIMDSSAITPYVKFTQDDAFAVCGGKLFKVDDLFFLVGGQRFDGRYNPMNGPSFTQTYTDAIRKFELQSDSLSLHYKLVDSIVSKEHLHRRDYNVLPEVFPDGSHGLIAFSGVFQHDVDLPFLDAVIIDADSFHVQPDFAQYYNHYHSAALSLFDSESHAMQHLFFGGIAQYYDSAGVLVQDNDVPFTRAISRVERDANGRMKEYLQPVSMPDYLGAAAEFIPDLYLPLYPNGVVDLQQLTSDTTLLGYVFGGICSSAPNVFWINTGVESVAANTLFPVYLIKTAGPNGEKLNTQSVNTLQLQLFPNPPEKEFSVSFQLKQESEVLLQVTDEQGKLVLSKMLKNLKPGSYSKTYKTKKIVRGKTYEFTLYSGTQTVTQKMLVH